MAVYAASHDIDCRRCTATLQQFLGCEKDIQPVDVWGYRVTRCAKKLATPTDFIYIQLYAEYKRGVLPNAGGVLDQPTKFFSVMNAIDGLMQKVEKEDG